MAKKTVDVIPEDKPSNRRYLNIHINLEEYIVKVFTGFSSLRIGQNGEE